MRIESLEPSKDMETYINGIHVFPLRETPSKEARYFDLTLPSSKEKNTYGSCFYVKPIWTRKKDEAITSIKIFLPNEELLGGYKQIVRISNDRTLAVLRHGNDEAKALDVKLGKQRKSPNATHFWSCTTNIGSKDSGCESETAYLCWRWTAKDTGSTLFFE